MFKKGGNLFAHQRTQRTSGYLAGRYAREVLGYERATAAHDAVVFAEGFVQEGSATINGQALTLLFLLHPKVLQRPFWGMIMPPEYEKYGDTAMRIGGCKPCDSGWKPYFQQVITLLYKKRRPTK